MLDVVLNILGAFIISFAGIYSWTILLNEKLPFKDVKFYLAMIFSTLLLVLNYNSLLKFTTCTLFFSLIIKFIFKIKFKNCIVTALYTQTLNIISELIFSIVAIFLLNLNLESGSINTNIIFFADIFVSTLCICAVKLKFIKKLYNTLINIVSKIKLKYFLLALLPLIFCFNAYLELTFYKIDKFYVFLLNNVSIYIVVIIVLILARKENEYSKISDKYNTTLNSLKEYEEILDKYKLFNHENKNQLLTIRNMLPPENKETRQYIDGIIKNNQQDDYKIMRDVSIIPVGGLRGLIYSKILYMKQNKINYELKISKEIRTVDLIKKLDESDMLDICQIMGVFIDNAIEETVTLKDKIISIQMYVENSSIVFEVSNNYKDKIELNKLDQRGYTTKGSGHGYGLCLVKKILEKNKKLVNERKISKELFVQILKIKM